MLIIRIKSQEPRTKNQEPGMKKNADEMDKLSKRDRIGPFGLLFSGKLAGIYQHTGSFPHVRD